MNNNTQTPVIAAWIKERRIEAGSHDRLAAMIGSSRQHIIKLEKGLHTPRREMIDRIAEATGTPAPLLDDEDEGTAPLLPLDQELLLLALAKALKSAAEVLHEQKEHVA